MYTVLLFAFFTLQISIKVFANVNGSSTPSPSNSSEQRVDVAADTLFDEYWQMNLMDNPEIATTLGDHRYDDKLNGYSLKCFEKRKVMMTEFLERASQLLPLAQEGTDTYNNIELFIVILQYKIDQLMSGSHLLGISKLYTPQMSLRYLMKYIKMDGAKNYWDLIARYRAFPQQIDELIELMREGIRTNFTVNALSLWNHGGDQNHTISQSPFYKPFLNISSTVSAEEANRIQSNASDAVMNSLYPALKKLDDFIENEYLPNTRNEIGVSGLPDGRTFYQQELAFHLTDRGVTAEEIHALGMTEVKRISEEMDEVIQSLGLNLTRKEFADKLRTDESNFFSSEEEALETYRNVIFNEITPKLPLMFSKIPGMALTVEKAPEDLAIMLAYYMSASPDNSTPATFYLDTTSLRGLPKHDVITLSLHEGVPGHHFQISYTMEQNDIPEFRKYGFNSNAFLEGWGLYSEFLGYELGLYEDPYMRYGHLSYEIFRACRMVVDTGMHVFGWSRQKAIDFMMDYSASPLSNIEREVDRYITWPGQACTYKYGEIKIKQLRKKAVSALGDKFDIKEFHDVILRNSGPLELVEKQVDRYIEKANGAETER